MARTNRSLDELRAELKSALLSDALDALGFRAQCLPAAVAPVAGDGVLVGRAFPVASRPVESPPEEPYTGLLTALDAIGPDEVFVVSAHGAAGVAIWGELLSTAALMRGAVGAVADGMVRDLAQIRLLGFPTFARGTVPYDMHGRLEIEGHRVPVTIGDVTVRPGDLIVADVDGIAVAPEEPEADAVERAITKSREEGGFRDDVRAGVAPTVAFARHRVL